MARIPIIMGGGHDGNRGIDGGVDGAARPIAQSEDILVLKLKRLTTTSPVPWCRQGTAGKRPILYGGQAIAKVNNIGGIMFPATPGSRGGRIHEGPLQGGTIPGHLTTRVHAVGSNSYLVTFPEQWTSHAFPVSGHARIRHHQWTFKVTPHLAQVQSGSGDYPTQATK
ncbi:MAG: hypothetical protein M0Z36_04490 [Thermaerobacter sp.]|nr:hypothetical protein [Thermaerobacter sp.]